MENKFNKPEVLYFDPEFIKVGCAALVSVVEHHRSDINSDIAKSNDHRVITSIVQKHDPVSGEFETRNTFYKPNILNG